MPPGFNAKATRLLVNHIFSGTATGLEHVQIEVGLGPDYPSSVIDSHATSIRVLTVPDLTDSTPHNWNLYTKLERLELRDMARPINSGSTLKYLRMKVEDASFDLSVLQTSYPVLEELHLRYDLYMPPQVDFSSPPNLRVLSFKGLSIETPQEFTFLDPSSPTNNIEHFNLTDSSFVLVSSWPQKIRSVYLYDSTIRLDSLNPIPAFPPVSNLTIYGSSSVSHRMFEFFQFENLEEIWIDSEVSEAALLYLNKLHTSPLRKIGFRQYFIPDETCNAFICESLLNIDTSNLFPGSYTEQAQERIRSLFIDTPMTSIPVCMQFLTTLEELEWHSYQLFDLDATGTTNPLTLLPTSITRLTLNIGDATPKTINFGLFFTHFYNETEHRRGLKYVEISQSSLQQEFPAEWIINYAPDIEHIDFHANDLAGTMPPDFFLRLGNLRYLDISKNRLDGGLPSEGYSRIETLFLKDNYIMAWSSNPSDAFISLVEVDLSNNNLRDIPDDYTFSRMPNLKRLDLSLNLNLKGPLPNVFGSDSKVEEFYAADCAFDGPFPASAISNPVLRVLDVSNNFVCSGLPHLNSLDDGHLMLSELLLGGNYFNGTYPASWGKMQTKILNISSNLISADVPIPFVFAFGYDSTEVEFYFNNVDLRGRLAGLDTFASINRLEANNTDLNLCDSLLSLEPEIRMCVFAPSACDCYQTVTACAQTRIDCPATLPPTFYYLPPPGTGSPLAMQCVSSVTREQTGPVPTNSSVPNSIPQRSPSSPCQSNPPSSDPHWICSVNGTWVYNGSFTSPSFVVSSNNVQVNGNLTISGTITFPAQGGVITVAECVFLGGGKGEGTVLIELTPQDLDRISKSGGSVVRNLIKTSGANNCPGSTDLSRLSIKATKKGSSCRKATIETVNSSRSSLRVLMTVDNSTCHMIIIIPVVIGAVIILVVAAIVTWQVVKYQKSKEAKAGLKVAYE